MHVAVYRFSHSLLTDCTVARAKYFLLRVILMLEIFESGGAHSELKTEQRDELASDVAHHSLIRRPY